MMLNPPSLLKESHLSPTSKREMGGELDTVTPQNIPYIFLNIIRV